MGFKETIARLLAKLKLAKLDGTYLKEHKKIEKVNLLILDDFGLQAFDNYARETLMDMVDDRHSQMSTIVSSQIPVSAWYDIIGEGTIADAILDRLVNSSHRIDLKGESLRKKILQHEQIFFTVLQHLSKWHGLTDIATSVKSRLNLRVIRMSFQAYLRYKKAHVATAMLTFYVWACLKILIRLTQIPTLT